MRFKPPTMLRKRSVRSMLAAGAVLASVSGLAFAQSAPAHADPTVTLVVVGSDTVQDVWNAFTTTAFAPGVAGSFNATNPATGAINEQITPTDGWAVQNSIVPNPGAANPLPAGTCSFERPNGSGQGVAALRLALNANSGNAGKAAGPVGLGCVDIARSSSVPDVSGTALSWVPFGLDDLAGSSGPASCANNACPTFTADLGNGTTVSAQTVASVIEPGAALFTAADLHTLYNCGTAIEGNVEYWPQGSQTSEPTSPTPPATSVQTIDLYQPQAGSGTRAFWESTNGINYPDNSPCVHDHIINGALNNTVCTTTGTPPVTTCSGPPVEEHDGTAVSTDPLGYGPFSAAQWIAQHTGHNPRYHGAVIQPISGVSPFTTQTLPTTGAGLNTSTFPVRRYVYDVVSTPRLSDPNDPISTLVAGVGSSICANGTLIQSYGFGLVKSTVYLGYTCGQTGLAALEGAG
jgi:hypothetical protein